MDERHFDAMARALSATPRRAALRTLLGAALAAVLIHRTRSPVAACQAVGERCKSSKTCCGDLKCLGHTCCKDAGKGCSGDGQCCSGTCQGGTCQCKPTQAPCEKTFQCCKPLAEAFCTPIGKGCFEGDFSYHCCQALGNPCTQDCDCCLEQVCRPNAQGEQQCCVPLGERCANRSHCCDPSDLCASPSPGDLKKYCCRGTLATCNEDADCCRSGLCQAFGEGEKRCCEPPGSTCVAHLECCSGACGVKGTCL